MLIRRKLPPVVMVQFGPDVDHFTGVEIALAERGVASERIFPRQPVPKLTQETRVCLVSNTEASVSRYAIRQAHHHGGTSVMVMDGLVEWRNTFVNPSGGRAFLRPAPLDVIACAGETDQRVLTAMGNIAVATGLPRLRGVVLGNARIHVAPRNGPRRVMVATAKRPAFDARERQRLVRELENIRQAAQGFNVEIVWRVTDGLDAELGVQRDTSPLVESLSRVDGVITTPSTLMIESMLCGVPTAVLHPHPTPLWQACAWVMRGDCDGELARDTRAMMTDLNDAAIDELLAIASDASGRSMHVHSARELIERLLAASREDMQRQSAILADLHAPVAEAADRVASVVAKQLDAPERSLHTGRFADEAHCVVRSGFSQSISQANKPRVVIVASVDEPAGNASSVWSTRIAEDFARCSPGYDVRVLLVVSAGDLWRSGGHGLPVDERTSVCQLDPYADNASNLERLMCAIEQLKPSILIATNRDICHAAAILVRARATAAGRSVRTIGATSDEEPDSRDLLVTYRVHDVVIDQNESSGASLAGVFRELERAPACPSTPGPSGTLGLRLVHSGHRRIRWADDPASTLDWIHARLREAGFQRIADGAPSPGCDCVVLDSLGGPEQLALAERCEAMGLGVVFAPTLIAPEAVDETNPSMMNGSAQVIDALRRATNAGCRRIVLYGAGSHLYRYAGVFDMDFPIVGIMDDAPPRWEMMYGVPVVQTSRVVSLRPDAVVLFSDLHEEQMWNNTRTLRERGVRVTSIYRSFDETPFETHELIMRRHAC